MKLKKKVSSRPESDETEADWMVTNPAEIQRAAKQAKVLSVSNRPPEFFMKAGAAKPALLRFRSDTPVASFMEYSAKVNGQFRAFVAPAEGQPDLFAQRLGLKPTRKYVFEVIDINGYTDKQGKLIAGQPKFYKIGTRVYEQLQAYAADEECGLSEITLRVRRTGSGTSTAYIFSTANSDPMPAEYARKPHLNPREYYKPLSLKEQSAIIGSVSASEY